MSQTNRIVTKITKGIPASDGAGVRLTRLLGTGELDYLDPFLMLDRFESDNPDDYIAGFPPHPHRGFETVTYILAGKMRHKDNQGHEGIIEAGGIQWMTAGRGIIHSEMPEQTNGLLKGFQLWVNLPAEQKMVAPSYQEFAKEYLGTEKRSGTNIKIISGTTSLGNTGPVKNEYIQPLFMDITLEYDAEFNEPLAPENTTFIVMISGQVKIGDHIITQNEVALLEQGDTVNIKSLSEHSQLLLISAKPIKEPIARGGPFVMNTEQEIEQAFNDYRRGLF